MPYRWIYAGLGLLAVAVVALGVAFAPSGEPVELPEPVEAVSPHPGDAVLPQAVVEVDMAVGYQATLFVNGFPVPPSEVTVVEGTDVYRWAPSPNSLVMPQWPPGTQQVEVVWDTVTGLPDPGSFTWEFRVQ